MRRPTQRPTPGERKQALLARHPRLAAQRPPETKVLRSRDSILLGTNDGGGLISIDDRPRLEHMHVIGATGCGKSTFLLNCILQDIARGRGVCVLDPHGGHPDSLLNMVLRFLSDHQWFAARRVHIIAPNIRKHVVGLNPLAPLPGTDPAVIAGAMVEAFGRVWGDEDTRGKPLTRRILRNMFIALAGSGLPLADAAHLLDYGDRPGLRRSLISTLTDENARREIENIERLSKQPRGLSDFEANVLGPANRLAEFLACEATRLMFSMSAQSDPPDRTIDLLDIMNRGHILLVDLQHGPAVDEAAADLLGKIVLRYLFLLMTHRKPYQLPSTAEKKYHPFYIYVDEAHRYVTDDVEGLLTQARKFGIGVTLAHQYLAQLGKPQEKIYEAVRNSTEAKIVFRVKSPDEAQALAQDVLPLSLELPVKASIRPTQTGYAIGKLNSETYSVHEGEGESKAVHAAEAYSHGYSEMRSWMRAVGHATGSTHASGTGWSAGSGTSEGITSASSFMESASFGYDPNTNSFISMVPQSMNLSSAAGSSHAHASSHSAQSANNLSRMDAHTDSEIVTDAEGGGFATSEARTISSGTSAGRNRSRGTGKATGSSEGVLPTYTDLPGSFHSKDSELYFKGEIIRNLPVGRAVIRFRNNVAFLNVPPPRKKK